MESPPFNLVRAIESGATSVSAPEMRFYGYRTAVVTDVAGNLWTICAPAIRAAARIATVRTLARASIR